MINRVKAITLRLSNYSLIYHCCRSIPIAGISRPPLIHYIRANPWLVTFFFFLSFEEECRFLQTMFSGSAYVSGPLSSDRWLVYVADKDSAVRAMAPVADRTLNIMVKKKHFWFSCVNVFHQPFLTLYTTFLPVSRFFLPLYYMYGTLSRCSIFRKR